MESGGARAKLPYSALLHTGYLAMEPMMARGHPCPPAGPPPAFSGGPRRVRVYRFQSGIAPPPRRRTHHPVAPRSASQRSPDGMQWNPGNGRGIGIPVFLRQGSPRRSEPSFGVPTHRGRVKAQDAVNERRLAACQHRRVEAPSAFHPTWPPPRA